jgi:hypothetical protein
MTPLSSTKSSPPLNAAYTSAMKPRRGISNQIPSTSSRPSEKDEWEKDLLDKVIKGSSREKNVKLRKVLANENETIIMVSDRGCKDKAGSYGWVIALESTGEILREHKGRARGGDMSSNRAEAYDMLSVVSFLVAYLEVKPKKLPAKCKEDAKTKQGHTVGL